MSEDRCRLCGQKAQKTDIQRNKFHAMCRELSKHIGETPGKIKEAIKTDFFGVDEYKLGSKWYRVIRPSESAKRDEYSELIDYTFIWAADNLGYVFNEG